MNSFKEFIYKKNSIFLFLIFTIITLAINFIAYTSLIKENLVLAMLLEKTSIDRAQLILENQKKMKWIILFIIPIINFIKFTSISSIIWIGLLFNDFKNINYKHIYKIVILSEFIFLIQPVIKIIYFNFITSSYTLLDLQCFSIISGLDIFNYEYIEPIWIYPLKTFNIFEITYWLLLSYGLSQFLKISLEKGMGVVLTSYVPSLFIWAIFVMYLQVII